MEAACDFFQKHGNELGGSECTGTVGVVMGGVKIYLDERRTISC